MLAPFAIAIFDNLSPTFLSYICYISRILPTLVKPCLNSEQTFVILIHSFRMKNKVWQLCQFDNIHWFIIHISWNILSTSYTWSTCYICWCFDRSTPTKTFLQIRNYATLHIARSQLRQSRSRLRWVEEARWVSRGLPKMLPQETRENLTLCAMSQAGLS